MYRCQNCQAQVPKRTPVRRLVVERREITYPCGSKGFETVSELDLCELCHTGASQGIPLANLRAPARALNEKGTKKEERRHRKQVRAGDRPNRRWKSYRWVNGKKS